MATEAQNIMQQFYSAGKREEIKDEERQFKKGAFGYMGGFPGFLYDYAGALEGQKMFQEMGSAIETLTDQRSVGQQIADEYVELLKTQEEATSILSAMGIKYKPVQTVSDITNKVMDNLGPMASKILGTEEFVKEVDTKVSSVKLNALDPSGNKFSYQLGGMGSGTKGKF